MPKISQKRVLELIGSMYDIAQQSSGEAWEKVYAEMAAILDCGPGSMWLAFPDADRIEFVCNTMDPQMIAEYPAYQVLSPTRGLVYTMRPGDTWERARAIPDKEFERSEFFREFLSRYGVYNWRHIALFNAGDALVCISLTKPRERARFTAEQDAVIAQIVPHLTRAFSLYANFAAVSREVKVLAKAFDRIPQCVLIIDRDRRVVFANESGHELLARRDGLELGRDHRLRTSSGGDGRRLRGILEELFSIERGAAAGPGGRLQLSRPSGQRSLEVMIAPFRDDHVLSYGAEDLAIVFVSDTEQGSETIEQALVHIHGLTRAETRIASLLANGHSLTQICELLNIRPNTGRTHLKHIFSKTGTSRQSELVKLILSGSGSLKK